MSLANPPIFALRETSGNHLVLQSGDARAHIFVLEQDIVRVMLLPDGVMRFPRSWSVCPGGEDVPAEGRDRFDLNGFSLPDFALEQSAGRLVLSTAQLRLTVALAGFHCRWENRIDGDWRFAASDRATQSYNFGWWDGRVYHYLGRETNEMFFGLGERAGDANRAGQSYRMTNIDAMGYNARTTDPLYKHIPFYISWRPAEGVPLGLFYDTLADCRFDLGRELDNYHGFYRSFVAESGDLDYYVIGGATPADITRRQTWLTGRPAMMPRWSLGYSGSTMSYTDAPDAQQRMTLFLEKCAEHDILCESFHLSSGYGSIGDKRYVFHWNRDKFPDPAGLARQFREHGVRLCANIKPCLLRSHPRFDEAAAAGLFIADPDGAPTMVQFWDEAGAYLDFTNPATRDWWRAQVIETLLATGLAATWNDNNEFEIWSDRANSMIGSAWQARPLQTLLMIQTSRQAQLAHAPDLRPFLISRAGTAGMQRYVQTWSGDNYTSWETLKYNIRMGTGLAISGISNIGHDIGGFAGPAPDAELLLRWVQFGIFLPRFSIHSWNDDKTVNEPWMHAVITPAIRELIRFRARLTPYLYDLLWKYHRDYEPMIRPTYYDFPDDPRCFAENDEMMLGGSLLVAAVVEPDQRQRAVYLPAGADWVDFWTGAYHRGGQTISLPARADHAPLLARAGSALPLNLAEQHFNQPADSRGFAIFPPAGSGGFEVAFFEDDGESERYRQGFFGQWELAITAEPETLRIEIRRTGKCPPPPSPVTLLLPQGERRKVILAGADVTGESMLDGWRRIAIAPV